MVGPDLPGCQGELLGVGLDTGTPTVLVPVTGRPFSLGEYAGRCAAVVQAFMPGVEGAGAVARVLSSGVNPSGRLPVVIPCPRGGQPGSYLTDPCAEVVRPLKQLIGFTKVDLVAGGSARVTFTVHADRFSSTGRDLARIVEPGEVLLSAGHSSEERLEPLVVEVVGARRRVPEGRVLTTPVSVEPL